MKRLSILLLVLLGAMSTFAQIDQVKGTGIRNTSGKPTIAPPDIDIATEFALDIANRTVYIWNRVSEDWERQLHVTQESGVPSGDPGTAPKLYWDIDTGRVYRWTGSAWEELGTGSGTSYTAEQFRDSLSALSGVNRLDAAALKNDTVTRMVNDSIIGYFVDGSEVERDTIPVGNGGGGSGAVSSVNSQTGAVVLDPDDLDDSATTNKFTTAGDISKLAGIESNATSDQTAPEIRDALGGLSGADRLDASAIKNIPTLLAPVTVFLFIGESNSGGLADNSDATASELEPRPEVQIFRNDNYNFEALDVGTNNLIGHTSLSCCATHGWELELANQVVDSLLLPRVFLIKAGHGGSNISQWDDGDTYYETFVSRVAIATDTLAAMGYRPVWNVFYSQGINDAILGTDSTTWSNATKVLHDNIRQVLGQSSAPIVMTRIMRNTANKIIIDDAIQAIADERANTYTVDVTGEPLKDTNHWDYDGTKSISNKMIRVIRDSVGYTPAIFYSNSSVPGGNYPVFIVRDSVEVSSSAGPVASEWPTRTNTVDEGEGTVSLSGTLPAGAISNITLHPDSNFTVTMRLDSSDLAKNNAVVLYIDDDNGTNYSWNSGNDYLAGMHVNGTTLFRTLIGASSTSIGTLGATNRYFRLRRSSDDIILEYSDDDSSYTTAYTFSGILTGAATTLYVKTLFAVASGDKEMRNVRIQESDTPVSGYLYYQYIDFGDSSSIYTGSSSADSLSEVGKNGSVYLEQDGNVWVKKNNTWDVVSTTDDQNDAEVAVTHTATNYTNSNSNLDGHLDGVDTQLGTITALIPDNITDLTISTAVDFNDNRITGVANATIDADAVNKMQLDSLGTMLTSSHALALLGPSNGDTVSLTNRETLIVMQDVLADPATIYLDGSALASGAKVYIKYGNYSSGLTIDRDDDNDAGNFIAVGATSGSTSITYTGIGFSALIKSGSSWYQMY